jgi:hypothetical protein
MNPEIVTAPAHAQCYICHTADFDQFHAVCHHCGRVICQAHIRPMSWSWLFAWLDFNGVALPGGERRDLVHCEPCAKQHSGIRRLGQGLLHLAERLWLPVSRLPFFRRLPLPISPAGLKAQVAEFLHGEISLDASGQYTQLVRLQATGRLVLGLQFTREDRERFASFRRARRLPADASLPFHAGFLVLKRTANLAFAPSVPTLIVQADTLALTGKTDDFPLLAGRDPQQGSRWSPVFEYNVVRPDGRSIPLPVQIVPTIVHDDQLSTLELEVRLRPDVDKWINFETAQIDQLLLYYPTQLGPVHYAQPSPATVDRPEGRLGPWRPKVMWRASDVLRLATSPSARCCVQFTQPLRPDMRLTGVLKLTFDGAFSQVEKVNVYQPWGIKLHQQPTLRRRTRVTIKFSFDLHSLAFHRVVTISERLPIYENLLPTTQFLIELTEEFNRQGIYLHHLVENPAHFDRTTAFITNQRVDLAARCYIGVCPIDVHIVLGGEAGNARIHQHRMEVDITVRGLAATLEQQAQIEQLQQDVRAAIEAVQQRVQLDPLTRRGEEDALNQMLLANNAAQWTLLLRAVTRDIRHRRRQRDRGR